jgi:hypothetical protein
MDEEGGWDDQIRCVWPMGKFTYFLETDEENGMRLSDERCPINQQVHVLPEDGRRGWHRIIRQWVSDQSRSSRTNWRQTKRMGWNDQTIGLPSIHKFTYFLETDEEDGIGLSDNGSPINPQVHVPTGDRRRGWDGMIRQ